MKNLFRRISSPQDTHGKSGGRQKFTLIELLMIKFYKRGVSLCLITSPAKSAPALRREAVSGKARSQSFSLSSSLIPMFSLSVFLHSIVELFQCSIVPMFSSFFLPCSRFDILTSQCENTNFHTDRASHRDCDHRDSGSDAAACAECSRRKSKSHFLCKQSETAGNRICRLYRGIK